MRQRSNSCSGAYRRFAVQLREPRLQLAGLPSTLSMPRTAALDLVAPGRRQGSWSAASFRYVSVDLAIGDARGLFRHRHLTA